MRNGIRDIRGYRWRHEGVARLLGLSKSARLRRGLNDHIKLYSTLSSHDELKQPATRMAELIDLQTSQLVSREEAAAHRVYDWGYLGTAIFAAALFAGPLWWLIPPNSLWQKALAVLLGGVAVLCLIVGVVDFRKQTKPKDSTTASDGVAVGAPDATRD
jgi:hypothetical protein